jgi:hypothetical protein
MVVALVTVMICIALILLLIGLPLYILGRIVQRLQERKAEREWEATKEERREREKQEHEHERERESITRECKELLERLARLYLGGSSLWDEMMRTARAVYGVTGSVSLEETVMEDVRRILVAFAVANGSVPNGLGRLYYALCEKQSWGEGLEREVLYGPRGGVKNFIRRIENMVEDGQHKPAGLPRAVELLSGLDKVRKTHLAAEAADAYHSLVIRASECCSASMAVDALRIKYFTSLQPYVSAEFASSLAIA